MRDGDGLYGRCRNHGGMQRLPNEELQACGGVLQLLGFHIGWGIARDSVIRGHVPRAVVNGIAGKRLLAECAAAGIRVVVERESMGIKWVRFEKEQTCV